MPKKCPICKEWIKEGEETLPFKDRTAHVKCFNIHMKAIGMEKQEKLAKDTGGKRGKKKSTAKPKVELKDGLSEEEYGYKKEFYSYLRQIMETDEIPVSSYAIVNNQITKYSFTYKGMKDTLVYLHDIKQINLTGNVVGIIPTYYSEAEKYYAEINRIEESNKAIDTQGMYKEKVVIIKPKKRVIKQMTFD